MSTATLTADRLRLLTLSRDVERINGYLNDPDVRSGIGHKELGAIDMTSFIEVSEHMFFVGDHGGFAALWRAPNVYEIHTFILPSGRGLWAMKAGREAIKFAKLQSAKMLWTCVPFGRPEIEFFCRAQGFKATGQILKLLDVPYKIFKLGEI